MDLMLKGLKAIVTGGTKGIGRAIADTFAAEGADVAICARNQAEVAEAVAALSAKGVKASGKTVDVADGPALQAWVAEAAAELGGLDIVVANVSALAIPADEENWRKGFDTDMMGTVRLVDAAMLFLQASKSAAIVTISSVSGREIDFASGPYGAFKAAIIHYTQGLAFHLAGKGIRANTVSPGIPISKAESGTASRTAIRTFTIRRSASIRPAGWARRKKWPMQSCSSPAPPRASLRGPIWSSTAL